MECRPFCRSIKGLNYDGSPHGRTAPQDPGRQKCRHGEEHSLHLYFGVADWLPENIAFETKGGHETSTRGGSAYRHLHPVPPNRFLGHLPNAERRRAAMKLQEELVLLGPRRASLFIGIFLLFRAKIHGEPQQVLVLLPLMTLGRILRRPNREVKNFGLCRRRHHHSLPRTKPTTTAIVATHTAAWVSKVSIVLLLLR